MSSTAPGAAALLDAAEAAGLRVACAPDTVLGAGIQTALRAIARGDIGDPLTAARAIRTVGAARAPARHLRSRCRPTTRH